MCLLIPLFYCTCCVLADNLLTLISPTPNQSVVPGHVISFNYTMNAVATKNTPNYPNSLDIIFQWVSKNNTQHMIQLTAARNLATDCNGIKNRVHLHSWKLPNCRFFKRYPPHQWTYSLIFQPNNLPVNKMTVPMGPQQASVAVPIILFMNTSSAITTKRHHSQEC